MNRYQSILLVVLIAAAAVGCLGVQNAEHLLLQHAPSVLFVVVMWTTRKRFVFSNASFTCLIAFMLLHVVGARSFYSNVPYDDWTETLFGHRLSVVFDWERNHYDRFVHLMFGMLWAVPARELFVRTQAVAERWSYLFSVQFVASMSLLYELVEWWVALTFAPEWADRYLGQQGDIWDAHHDSALAVGGATIVMCVAWFMNRRRAAEARTSV